MFADYAFQRYIEKGLPPHVAAAVVGAFQQESGADLDPMAVHDEGTGFGIAGWRDPEPGKGRKTNLMNWASQNDLDPEDIDTQLDYFLHEVTEGEERTVGERLMSAQTVDEAADAMVHYERPEGYDQNDVTKANGYDNRVNNAKTLLASYTGESAPTQSALPSADDPAYNPELEEYPEAEEDTSVEEDADSEKYTDTQRAGKAIMATGQKAMDAASEPLDYTPGGENTDVEQPMESGIPTNAYEQFTSLYADGGVVGENDIEEYFKSLGVK